MAWRLLIILSVLVASGRLLLFDGCRWFGFLILSRRCIKHIFFLELNFRKLVPGNDSRSAFTVFNADFNIHENAVIFELSTN
jgi:hypothetical protein